MEAAGFTPAAHGTKEGIPASPTDAESLAFLFDSTTVKELRTAWEFADDNDDEAEWEFADDDEADAIFSGGTLSVDEETVNFASPTWTRRADAVDGNPQSLHGSESNARGRASLENAIGASRTNLNGYSVQAYEEDAKELPPQKALERHVTFDLDSTIVYEVTPYAEVYGMHPKMFDFDKKEEQIAWCFVAPPDTSTDSDSEQNASDSDEDEDEQPFISRNGRHPYEKLKDALDVFVQKASEVDDEVSTQDTIDSAEGSLVSWSDDEDEEDEEAVDDESVEHLPDSVQSLHEALSLAFVSPPEVDASALHTQACFQHSYLDFAKDLEPAESSKVATQNVTLASVAELRVLQPPSHRRTRSVRIDNLESGEDV